MFLMCLYRVCDGGSVGMGCQSVISGTVGSMDIKGVRTDRFKLDLSE
jgi:hypothetical protein